MSCLEVVQCAVPRTVKGTVYNQQCLGFQSSRTPPSIKTVRHPFDLWQKNVYSNVHLLVVSQPFVYF